jgi:hypothetical protein
MQQRYPSAADTPDFLPHIIHRQQINSPDLFGARGVLHKAVDQVKIEEIRFLSPPLNKAILVGPSLINGFNNIMSSHGAPPVSVSFCDTPLYDLSTILLYA